MEITVPLDTNLKTGYNEKELKYIPFISNMQRVYSEFRFQMVIITLGAIGTIPKNLEENLQKLYFTKNRIKVIIEQVTESSGDRNNENLQNSDENVKYELTPMKENILIMKKTLALYIEDSSLTYTLLTPLLCRRTFNVE